MSDNEYIKRLIKLSEENPTLQIIAKVDSECCPSDDHGWWGCSIGNSEVDVYWLPDEDYVIGEEEIKEEISCNHDSLDFQRLSEEEQYAYVQERYDEYKKDGEIKEAIFLEINN
jgi:hypothetical protein